MHLSIRHAARTTALTLSGAALGVGAILAPTATAAPPTAPAVSGTDDTASRIAAHWLAGQLKDGLVVGQFGADFGLTIDAGFALAAAGDTATVDAINAALEPRIAEYVGDGTTESYAGALAKAATFARTAGDNPTDYGKRNLVSDLEARTADASAGATAGRISDASAYGDYANVAGQSYAVRALTAARSREAGAALDFLLKQQCSSGYFRLNFSNATSANQSCTEGAAGSEADPDATSIAIVNLVEARVKTPAAKAALDKAGAWLATRQLSNGGFRGGAGTTVPNTNSTSLAGYALGMLKNTKAASRAAVWVRKLQPVDKRQCRSALTKDTGAVAYSRKTVVGARTGGITAGARDEWRRATAQAVLGLRFAPASSDDLGVESTRRVAGAGDRPRFRVSGISPGERACLQVKGDFVRLVGKPSGGVIVRRLQMPTGNQRRVVLVRTADDAARTSLRVRT